VPVLLLVATAAEEALVVSPSSTASRFNAGGLICLLGTLGPKKLELVLLFKRVWLPLLPGEAILAE